MSADRKSEAFADTVISDAGVSRDDSAKSGPQSKPPSGEPSQSAEAGGSTSGVRPDSAGDLLSATPSPSAPAPGSAPPPPGESLQGASLDHFQIGELIGKGGMGEVYSAVDTSLDRTVAIKVLRGDVLARAGMTERFLREARAQARFNHPNIVHIYYIGLRPTPGGSNSLFLAMEQVAGGDLADLLSRGERLPAEEARLAMMQIASGLKAAHRAGVIHRDIKPSNLMIASDGTLKIADFGLAKPLEGDNQITQEGALVGSPYYMAPEQALGEEIDHRADMYSLGAAFYHLLSGEPPFEGPRPMAVVAKHLSEPPTPLAQAAPDVSPELARIIERLLAKKADERYANYDELIAELEEAAPGRRPYASVVTRAAAVLGDFIVAGMLIGLLGWPGLIVYLGIVTIGHARRGQTPAKYLMNIEVRRTNGELLGWWRSLSRTLISLWMPIIAGISLALVEDFPELRSAIEHLSPGRLADLQSLLVATAMSHGLLSVVYAVGLGMALFHPQRKTVHDLVVDSVVTYRLSEASGRPVQSASSDNLELLAKQLSTPAPATERPAGSRPGGSGEEGSSPSGDRQDSTIPGKRRA